MAATKCLIWTAFFLALVLVTVEGQKTDKSYGAPEYPKEGPFNSLLLNTAFEYFIQVSRQTYFALDSGGTIRAQYLKYLEQGVGPTVKILQTTAALIGD